MLRRCEDQNLVERRNHPRSRTNNYSKEILQGNIRKNLEFLTKGDKPNSPNLINVMIELRKCCIYPYLIKST